MKKSEIISKSESTLLNFLKEFNICPPMLTKGTVHLLYIDLIEKNIDKIENPIYFLENDIGTIFSFSRFIYPSILIFFNQFFIFINKNIIICFNKKIDF